MNHPPEHWQNALPPEEAAVLAAFQRPREPLHELEAPALLVIDAVESFFGPDEPVATAQSAARTACGVHAWRAVGPTARLLERFRGAALPVLYTVVDDLQRQAGGATVGEVPPPREEALRSDRVVDALAPTGSDVVVPKTKASAFAGTPALSVLVRRGVRSVVLSGCTTSGCVLATAIDACSAGFTVVVASDACFDRAPTLADAALVTMDAKWARVLPADEVCALLPSQVRGAV